MLWIKKISFQNIAFFIVDINLEKTGSMQYNPSMNGDENMLSVVIPVYNEEKRIKENISEICK